MKYTYDNNIITQNLKRIRLFRKESVYSVSSYLHISAEYYIQWN